MLILAFERENLTRKTEIQTWTEKVYLSPQSSESPLKGFFFAFCDITLDST